MTENEPSALKQLLDAVTEGTIQVGPPANGDHITRQEILEISSRENQDPPLYLLCDRYRAVDVYHALQREADAGTIQPVWKDEDTGYIFRWTKVDPPPGT